MRESKGGGGKMKSRLRERGSDDVDGSGGDTCLGGLKKVVEGRC